MREPTHPWARLVLFAMLAAGCALAGHSGAAPRKEGASEVGLTAAEAGALVEAHNRWRARVGVRPLGWSARLAGRAQEWADRLAMRGCRLRHRGASDLGENLFFAGPRRRPGGASEIDRVTPEEVVNAWGAEHEDYSYARNACAPGHVCGHYTQLVWSASEDVGCGVAVCPSLAQIWVCSYHPAGNVQRRRPY